MTLSKSQPHPWTFINWSINLMITWCWTVMGPISQFYWSIYVVFWIYERYLCLVKRWNKAKCRPSQNWSCLYANRQLVYIHRWSTAQQTTNVVQWQSSNQIIIVVISSVIRLNSYSWRSIYILRCGNYHNNSDCVHLGR